MPLLELDRLPPGFMHSSARELHRLVPAPTLVHLAGEDPQPLLVSVLLHGNEDAGLLALQRVLARFAQRTLPRALSIFIGNVDAAREGVRHLDHEPDFNRIWAAGNPTTPWEQMAAAVVHSMKARDVFAVLDLHNNSGRNPFFACVNAADDRHLHLASLFAPLAVLIQSPTSLGAAFTPICPTVSCECGEIGNADGVARAAELIEKCLGMSRSERASGQVGELALYEIFAVLKVPDTMTMSFDGQAADIRFVPDIESLNFRSLAAGQAIANVSVAAETDPLLVLRPGGEAIEGLLRREGDAIRLSREAVAAMLTRDERAIRQDCLGYLMKPLACSPLPFAD